MDDSWTRSCTPAGGRWLVIGWEAFALALLGWTTVRQFDLAGHGIRIMAGVLAAVWLTGAWRILRMGVYVGTGGMLIRGLLWSRTIRWADIDNVRLHLVTHRVLTWEIRSGMTVLIELRAGRTMSTGLWAQGVDFHARPEVFREVYHELRTRHLDATRAAV